MFVLTPFRQARLRLLAVTQGLAPRCSKLLKSWEDLSKVSDFPKLLLNFLALLKTLQDASKNSEDFSKQMALLQEITKVAPDFHNFLKICDQGMMLIPYCTHPI